MDTTPAQQIIDVLVANGMTQTSIARAIGCRRESINRIVTGRKSGNYLVHKLYALYQLSQK